MGEATLQLRYTSKSQSASYFGKIEVSGYLLNGADQKKLYVFWAEVQTYSLDLDFLIGIKCTIIWINRGLRVYFDMFAADFPNSTGKYFRFGIMA